MRPQLSLVKGESSWVSSKKEKKRKEKKRKEKKRKEKTTLLRVVKEKLMVNLSFPLALGKRQQVAQWAS